MKTKIIFIMVFVLIEFSSYSQRTNFDTLLIREKGPSSWIIYKDKNWNNKFNPIPENSNYVLENSVISVEGLKSIAREEISAKYYELLNNSLWVIETILTCKGQIVSVAFNFRDESAANIKEFTKVAERIKNEMTWKLTFNKEVADSFYLRQSIKGPKL